MRWTSYLQRVRRYWKSHLSPRPGAQLPRLLHLESLEDRTAPAVVYDPLFGNETQKQDGGAFLSSPPVYLIFWGSYWGGTNTVAANSIRAAATRVLSSPYLTGLGQYHSDGRAQLSPVAAYDSSNPPDLGFDGGRIDDVIQNQIDNGTLPESDDTPHTGLYVVVTPPGIQSSDGRNVAGFNRLDHDTDLCGVFCIDHDDVPEIWTWTGNNRDGTINIDQFTLTLSHEVAEIMSDLGGGGYKVNPGPFWSNGGSGNQIGDYEGNAYSWREPNGALVQPFWSAQDQKWLARDGNSQAINLTPQWTGNQYANTNVLTVRGDQRGVGSNDTITIDQTPVGGVRVTLNGETTAFDPGQISAIFVYPGGGNNTVTVLSTSVPTDLVGTPGAGNTLVGANVNTTWNITRPNSGNMSSSADARVIFTDFTNLTGGSADDTFNFSAGASLTGEVDGGGGSNTVNLGAATANLTVNVTGPNNGNIVGVSHFTSAQNLTTGSGDDTFVYFGGGSLTGTIDGGGGRNTLDLGLLFGTDLTVTVTGINSGTIGGGLGSFISIPNLTTSSGNDTFVIRAGAILSGTINGGGGSNTLNLSAATNNLTVNVTGANTGTIAGGGVGPFTSIQNITTGSGNDTFSFSAGASLAGTVDGGGGTNTLNLGAATANLTVNITGVNAGSIGGVASFTSVQNLTTGGGNDTFVFFSGGSVSGTINGGSNTLNLSRATGNLLVTVTGANAGSIGGGVASFTSVQNVTTGSGNDTFTFSAGASLSGTVNGGGGTNTLNLGAATANLTVNVTGTNAGSIGGVASFSSIQNLTTGSGNDTFVFSASASLSGTLNGGGGTNTLNLSADTVGLIVNVTGANTGTVLGGHVNAFVAIQNITTGSGFDLFNFSAGATLSGTLNGGGGSNTLILNTTANVTVNVTAANAGNVAGGIISAFLAIQNITTGSGNDTFAFSNGGSLSGGLNGGGGTNTLDFGAVTSNLTIDVTGANAGVIPGSFAAIQNITTGMSSNGIVFSSGASLTGTLNSRGGTNALNLTAFTANLAVNVTGVNSGTIPGVVGTFAAAREIDTGSGNDTFTFSNGASLAGTLNGGGGTNTLTLAAAATVNVTGANAGNAGNFVFTAIQNITTGAGDDTFTFFNGGSLAGTLNGGGGANTLILASAVTVNVIAANAGSVAGGIVNAFTAIQNITTGSGDDTFTFSNGASLSGTLNGGGGTNTLNLGASAANLSVSITGVNRGRVAGVVTTFSAIQNVTTGSGNDTFTFGTGASLSGTISGGGGTNTLDFGAVSSFLTVNVTAANGGNVPGWAGAFASIQNLTTGSGSNTTFVFRNGGSLSGTLKGGGTDTLDLSASTANLSVHITGADAGNVTGGVLNAFTGIAFITTGSGNDTFAFSAGASLDGSLDGGGGTNTLDLGASTANLFVLISSLFRNTVVTSDGNLVVGAFTAIQNLTTGSGNDSIEVAGSLPGVLNGGGGTNSLTLDSAGNLTTNITAANAGNVPGMVGTFTSIQNLTTRGANDTFAFSAGASLSGTLTGLTSTLDFSAVTANLTVNVTGINRGTVPGVVGGFALIGNLIGGGGNNTFAFADGARISGTVDGGAGGNNTLDYSTGWSDNVLVNLQTGAASGIAGLAPGGIADIQSVIGASGGGAGFYNILVGNGGNYLQGGDGRRNLLVAGGSASTLQGGNDDDILIGGSTAYDGEADMHSFIAMMTYWAGTTDDYFTRVNNLTTGNGVPLLDATTVFNNGGGNTLLGNNGGAAEMNLFYGLDPTLETTDSNPGIGEVFINV